jgi:hypothetical protein
MDHTKKTTLLRTLLCVFMVAGSAAALIRSGVGTLLPETGDDGKEPPETQSQRSSTIGTNRVGLQWQSRVRQKESTNT